MNEHTVEETFQVHITPFRISAVRFERGQIGWKVFIGHRVTTDEQSTDIYMEAGDSRRGNSWITPIRAFFAAMHAAKNQHKECSATPEQRRIKGWA